MSDEVLKEVSAAEYHTASPESQFGALADELYKRRVLRARKAPPEEKILAGQRLFEAACRITLLGIRQQFPNESLEKHRQILRERLAVRRKWENET